MAEAKGESRQVELIKTSNESIIARAESTFRRWVDDDGPYWILAAQKTLKRVEKPTPEERDKIAWLKERMDYCLKIEQGS